MKDIKRGDLSAARMTVILTSAGEKVFQVGGTTRAYVQRIENRLCSEKRGVSFYRDKARIEDSQVGVRLDQ